MKRLPVWAVVGPFVALLVTFSIGGLSQVRWEANDTTGALIRLAWKTRSARVEHCRAPTEEELAGTPAHMRPQEICERRMLPYHLVVDLNGERVIDETVRGAGARGDRPIVVFYELEVPAGSHAIEVDFVREEPPGEGESNDANAPGRLNLRRDLELGPKEVSLITYDVAERSLTVAGYGSTATRSGGLP